MMLHFLVPRVGEHNMGMVRKVEKMRRVRGVERIERVRGVEKIIEEIK